MARGRNFGAFSVMESKIVAADWVHSGKCQTSGSSSTVVDGPSISFEGIKPEQSTLTDSSAMMQKNPGRAPTSYDPPLYALSSSLSGADGTVEDKLSNLLHNKLCLSDSINTEAGTHIQSRQNCPTDSSEIEWRTIGSLLPDDDDLFTSAASDMNGNMMGSYSEENEELDLFSSGGGLELENDSLDTSSWTKKNADDLTANGSSAVDYPYCEHPSRTLFVRNINSSVEDAELRVLFEQFGDIRTLYTACKHRGFVMISYYDIRAARIAMRALQNKSLRRRKLDIHFSIPKDNPPEKDINQGTLVVFNLDASVSNDELRQIVGVYGEVKEIRETPHKRHHKFIEFYDVRSAEAALRALNRCDIAGKRIKLEPSRPGGARRSLMQNLPFETDAEESLFFKEPDIPSLPKSLPVKLPVKLTLPDAHFLERDPLHRAWQSKYMGHRWHPLAPLLPASSFFDHAVATEPTCLSASAAAISVMKEQMCSDHLLKMGFHGINISSSLESASGDGMLMDFLHPHSMDSLPADGLLASSLSTLYQRESGSALLPQSPTRTSYRMNGFAYCGELKPYNNLLGGSMASTNQHHVGSAPVTVFPLLDRNHLYIREPLDALSAAASVDRGLGFSASHFVDRSQSRNSPPGALLSSGLIEQGQCSSARSILQHQKGSLSSLSKIVNDFAGRSLERSRGRKTDNGVSNYDKKQYELDIQLIIRGEDSRTTLMIKNIPNKYTSKMLLAAIDEHHRGTYDFIYLPIDFKNKCNVGYAFINMTEPSRIIPFYQAFNGKRWEKFNSEKVASLAYARIQGKAALIAHFQNSSLMNEDKRCRPILFHSEGPNVGGQEPFPIGTNPRPRLSKGRGSHPGSCFGRY